MSEMNKQPVESSGTGKMGPAIFLIHFAFSTALLGVNQALYDISGSVVAFSSFLSLQIAIQFSVSLISGSVVDRVGPNRVLTLCCVLLGGVISSLLITPIDKAAWPLGVLLTLLAFYGPFIHQPLFAYLGRLSVSGGLQRTYGTYTAVSQGSQILGTLLAVPLLNRFGIRNLLVLVGISFIISGWLFSRTTMAPSVANPVESPQTVAVSSFWDFLPSLRNPPLLLGLVHSVLPLSICALFNIALPQIADISRQGSEFSSVLDAAFCVGATLAGLLVSQGIYKKYSPSVVVPVVLAICLVAELVLLWPATTRLAAALLTAASLCFGLCVALQSVHANMRIQVLTGPSVKGRTAAVQQCINMVLVLVLSQTIATFEAVKPFYLALVLTAFSFLFIVQEPKHEKQLA